ncbi:TPA: HNH endonuclease signature motif containing protein [Acinetobacter baumannii]|jgi:5-methylcytosine-specific restriction endonuclease McrA|uniref:HNH endonuclease domain-containing protein n=1 Tax=Acinetobacter TaxID=469 RepID=UPI000F737333|nr:MULTISPECIES: HNH endonuclease signature motif containing protein [Acinetobacter]ELB0344439.1 HNH endonuclease [Acinetobacter baumannii]MBK4748136.1 CRISPR-associated endonuclease Cas9 [Acinetobacter baumannii]MCY0273883.1 HNH endonuclease [Acinetobacter baumannii]RSO15605.1 HNH endonuclease [Acinetobacter pittii]HCV3188646.1 HNH endonuclease [Acinetobacter baumannii]
MFDFIPTAQEQLKFLKNIQLILQSGSFSSTYKFALLISLSRLSIEKGEDEGGTLILEYTDLAEKFIELYWKQAVPYTFHEDGQLILNQNNGKQAAIVNRIILLRQSYSSLGLLRRDTSVWLKLLKEVAKTIKEMPVRYLQNINGQNFEFLYRLEYSNKQLTLLPQVMYCLRQFSEIIEELCQKRWIDYIRKNSTNAPILNKLPNLEQFMFEPSRNQLNAVANVLVELQECKCFYCNKSMKKGSYAVDHFIPWSMYPSDTGHNFVLADSSCNSKKSNLLASDEFLHKWRERNEEQDLIIVDRISVLGFLTDKERSHKVADWAYAQGKENGYILFKK